MKISWYQKLPLFSVFLVSTYAYEDWWNFGLGHSYHLPAGHPHHLPSAYVPPQKSVCDKMLLWMEMLGHNNSYSCSLLPRNAHGTVLEYCNVAGLETFNNCNKVGEEQSRIEECLDESLQDVEETSNLFNRCLCHGYIENYAGMLAIWKMMCDDFPYSSYDDLLSHVASVEKNDRVPRDYSDEFTTDNQKILKGLGLTDRTFVRNDSLRPSSHMIKWTQFSRCGFSSCEEEYLLVDYYIEGYKTLTPYKVYVAKSDLSPPSKFSTSGYKGKLHFGFLYYGKDGRAVFFVLHPNSWGPYQHRFKTNAFTEFVMGAAQGLASTAVAYVVGAAIGTFIPVPYFGTFIGGLLGIGVRSLTKSYFGDYLRYIG